MRAKSLLQVACGLLMLATAYQVVLSSAQAGYVDTSAGHVVAWHMGQALRSDGTVWRWDSDNGWRRTPSDEVFDPPVAIEEIVVWDAGRFITRAGEMYVYCFGGCSFLGQSVNPGWHVVGTIPAPTVQVEGTTMTNVKGKFRDRENDQ